MSASRFAPLAVVVHQTPEVMAVWEPMTPMLESLEILAWFERGKG
jgi:hypothetical protein